MPKLDQLLELLKSEPDDAFLRYGVAMEYQKAKQHDKAIAEFEELSRRNPDYVAGYFMWGRSLEQNGDVAGARTIYKRGIEVARKVGDNHAASEINEALEMLNAGA